MRWGRGPGRPRPLHRRLKTRTQDGQIDKREQVQGKESSGVAIGGRAKEGGTIWSPPERAFRRKGGREGS